MQFLSYKHSQSNIYMWDQIMLFQDHMQKTATEVCVSCYILQHWSLTYTWQSLSLSLCPSPSLLPPSSLPLLMTLSLSLSSYTLFCLYLLSLSPINILSFQKHVCVLTGFVAYTLLLNHFFLVFPPLLDIIEEITKI